MKKWFKAHIKQFFACVGVFLFSFSVFVVGAFAYDVTQTTSPSERVPLVPVLDEYGDDGILANTYDFGTTGNTLAPIQMTVIEPVADFNINCQTYDVANEYLPVQESYPLAYKCNIDNDNPTFSKYTINSKGSYSSLVLNVAPSGVDVTYPYGRYFTYDCHLKAEDIFDNVIISADPFWYCPYDYNNNKYYYDTICELVIYEAGYLNYHPNFEISGTFYYYGNTITGHDFKYQVAMNANRQVFVSYRDIVTSIDYGKASWNELANDTYVPIYITNLSITSTDNEVYYTGSNFDFTVSCRYRTTGDYFCDVNGDNTMVYLNTVDHACEAFEFGWIVNALEGFFEAEFFGAVTLGGLAFSVIALTFVLGIFKLIKGI